LGGDLFFGRHLKNGIDIVTGTSVCFFLFDTGRLGDPFVIDSLAAVAVDLSGRGRALVVGDNGADHLIFAPVSDPPGVGGIVYVDNSITIGPGGGLVAADNCGSGENAVPIKVIATSRKVIQRFGIF